MVEGLDPGTLLARQADSAGRRTAVWMTVSVLAAVEALGSITGSRWPTQVPALRDWLWRVTDGIGQHVPLPAVDPYQAWASALAPPPRTWLAYAATAVFLLLMLAVLRQHRGTSVSMRAVRLACAYLSWLLMLGYGLHLVTTGLAPVLSVLASVSMVLLAFLAGAVVAIVRLGAGRRPTTLVPPKLPGRRRLRRALVIGAALVVAAGALQYFPAPGYRPVLTAAIVPANAVFRTAVAAGRVVFVAAGPTALDVTAITADNAVPLWVRHIDRAAEPDVSLDLLTAGDTLVIRTPGSVHALSLVDGKDRWTQAPGVVHAGANVLLYENQAGDVYVVNPADGAVVASAAALAPAPAQVWLADDLLVRVAPTQPYTVTAYQVPDLATPKWTYTGPADAAAPSAVVGCDGVCLADSSGLRAIDPASGGQRWERQDVSGAAVAGSSRHILVQTDHGAVIVDPAGRLIGRFARHTGYPVGASRVLLVERGTDRVSLFDAGTGRWNQLGVIHVRWSDCAWDERYLACAGPSARVWLLP
jgi:hypothetical protein